MFPLIAAAVLLLVRNEKARGIIVVGSAAAIILGSLYLAIGYLCGQAEYYQFQSAAITYATLVIDIILGVFIFYMGIKYKKPLASVLAVIQVLIVVVFEFFVAHDVPVENALYIDSLSVIMALIIGIVGSGICIYAVGYMRDFTEHHNDQPDRRHIFFALMFVFLSAMFGIVFLNSLAWLFCAWEITTVCSFLLIGYTRTDEAMRNSFRQIIMNMFGGLAFAIALVYFGAVYGILELDKVVYLGAMGGGMFPIALLAFAAITKAAQMPFHTWLLGAMVAPTPTSALLHSSTMVKAGVFLLVKLSPAFGWNPPGTMIMLVGGLTFLFCSYIAISQSNAKRVLAYSTVANLGLIVACAGVGTPEAIWAAIFLVIFHAVAKSLLFLCVGTAEHHIDSRDIEDMDDLFVRMPRLAKFMSLGMFCMFIAPFGMLVSKWATIVSIVDTGNITLILILAFGSAATFMFWAKWLGKISAIAQGPENIEGTVRKQEWVAIWLMAIVVVFCCVAFPAISAFVVVPYLSSMWGTVVPAISFDNLLIMAIIVIGVLVLFVAFSGRTAKGRKVDVYMSGVGMNLEERTYRSSLSVETKASQRNWYLADWFGEKILTPVADIMCTVILIVGTLASLIPVLLGMGGGF